MLEAIGWWYDPNEPACRDPKPEQCVIEWEEEYKARVLSYLKQGCLALAFLGYDSCRFNCGVADSIIGSKEFTDGKFVWPESLVHYIEVHNVGLPEEFLQFVEGRNFKVPDFSDEEIQEFSRSAAEQGYSEKIWCSWASELT